MTSDLFISWLEARLVEHGAGKVVPESSVLAEVWQRAVARQHIAKDLRQGGDEGHRGPQQDQGAGRPRLAGS